MHRSSTCTRTGTTTDITRTRILAWRRTRATRTGTGTSRYATRIPTGRICITGIIRRGLHPDRLRQRQPRRAPRAHEQHQRDRDHAEAGAESPPDAVQAPARAEREPVAERQTEHPVAEQVEPGRRTRAPHAAQHAAADHL